MLAQLTFVQTVMRGAEAAFWTTLICVPLAFLLLKLTGVPPTYPPLLPQQIIAGTVGGAILATLGYGLISTIFQDSRAQTLVFLGLALLILLASFHLPYRLSYTTSPRFAGVNLGAQISQGLLHCIVVVVSAICFFKR